MVMSLSLSRLRRIWWDCPRSSISFLRKLAGLAVRHKFGVTEGRVFSVNYAAILSKWSARLSAMLTREVVKCIIEGARLARGGDQIDSSFDRLDMFETALPRLYGRALSHI